MSLLSVQNVGKSFRGYRSEWQRFARWMGFPIKPSTENWVLRGINFSIKAGESIGIIGQNGAGKSTLLKIITGTLQPSEGQIQVNGRIAAILELGMGFNPDLTGRQNAWHGLGLMGFNHSDIERIMPELEDFSEIGEYFDQPVRVYSSGMQMRVAFAVVTSYQPDLLIIDEALAVGDAAFQRKCFRRIEKFINDGMSLLLVSHDVESIKKICSKALFLKEGLQQVYGEAKLVCDKYEQHLFESPEKDEAVPKKNPGMELSPIVDSELLVVNEICYGNGKATIKNVFFENIKGQRCNVFAEGGQFFIKYTVLFNSSVKQPIFAFLVKTIEGIALYGIDTQLLGLDRESYESGDCIEVEFLLDNCLNVGTYFINCGVRSESEEIDCFLHRRVDVAMFKVYHTSKSYCAGLTNLNAKCSVSMLMCS